MRPAVRTLAALTLAAVFVCLFAGSCGRASEEIRIRELLERAAARAEKRDIAGLAGLFAADYRDFEGRDKDGTVRLVTDYLDRYRGVVVHVLGVHPGAIGPDGRAEVTCEVALSHGAAEVLRKLVRIGSEYYRFQFDLRKDAAGEWRFAYAAWESIALSDLLPESLDILRKLFPDL
jgi:hypothetical protein